MTGLYSGSRQASRTAATRSKLLGIGSDRVYVQVQRSDLILFWMGFVALFRGVTQIMLAFSIRHAGEEAAAIDPAPR